MAHQVDDYFRQKLLYNRNQIMAERIEQLLNNNPSQSFFFAVGAGNLPNYMYSFPQGSRYCKKIVIKWECLYLKEIEICNPNFHKSFSIALFDFFLQMFSSHLIVCLQFRGPGVDPQNKLLFSIRCF